MEKAPVVGAEAPSTGPSLEEPASTAEALASATVAPAGATAASPEPSRKRKRSFSNLRQVVFPPCALGFEGPDAHPWVFPYAG
jgi:hypothetical protein